MAKVPRLGEPQYSELCSVIGKLATDGAALDNAERMWLVELLDSLRLGEDVSNRFTKNAKLSPEAERHFWIACDVAQHIHDGRKPAHDLVAARWGVQVETLQTIVKRQRKNTDAIAHLIGDGWPIVIEHHRARLK